MFFIIFRLVSSSVNKLGGFVSFHRIQAAVEWYQLSWHLGHVTLLIFEYIEELANIAFWVKRR